jgi:hypothetical protein
VGQVGQDEAQQAQRVNLWGAGRGRPCIQISSQSH